MGDFYSMKSSLTILTAVLVLGMFTPGSHAQGQGASGSTAVSDSADLSQYTTADALWQHIQVLQKGPQIHPKTMEEYRAAITTMCTQKNAAATAFIDKYPADPRKWDARLMQIDAQTMLGRISGHDDPRATAEQLQALANQSDAPASARGQARYELLMFTLRDYVQGAKGVTSTSLLEQLKQFANDFPTHPSLDLAKYQVAKELSEADPAASTELLKEVANSGGHMAATARKDIETAEKLKSPLDLHFTAVDGSQVDLSAMRGKVVLVDFWATWCGPCKAEVPNVVDTYKKFHDKGFEVVGISLDQSKDSLTKYIAENGMTWPQYFDGKGWENSISSGFGINSIPAMWLINKKGYVVTTNGRSDLAGQVEKLLAE